MSDTETSDDNRVLVKSKGGMKNRTKKQNYSDHISEDSEAAQDDIFDSDEEQYRPKKRKPYKNNKREENSDSESPQQKKYSQKTLSKNTKADQKALVDRIFENGHILVTTYAGLRVYDQLLLERKWSYAILDEGHKIRNPDANITIKCKQIKVFKNMRILFI
jgi:DNA excision repair protein ERCC-6